MVVSCLHKSYKHRQNSMQTANNMMMFIFFYLHLLQFSKRMQVGFRSFRHLPLLRSLFSMGPCFKLLESIILCFTIRPHCCNMTSHIFSSSEVFCVQLDLFCLQTFFMPIITIKGKSNFAKDANIYSLATSKTAKGIFQRLFKAVPSIVFDSKIRLEGF